MRAHVFNVRAQSSVHAFLVHAHPESVIVLLVRAHDLNLEFGGTFFPTNVVDDLTALVLGSGCPTKWFGLSYDIKIVLYHFFYFVHDFPYATLVHC